MEIEALLDELLSMSLLESTIHVPLHHQALHWAYLIRLIRVVPGETLVFDRCLSERWCLCLKVFGFSIMKPSFSFTNVIKPSNFLAL